VAASQSSALKIVIFTFQEEFVINEDYKLTAHQMSQLWEEKAGESDDKEFLKRGRSCCSAAKGFALRW